MTDTGPAPDARLDSWKAISDYLGRDERTVRRWEKESGLPIRRVPGRRGHSVFAYVTEIEAWLRTSPPSRSTHATVAPINIAGTLRTASTRRRTQVLAWSALILVFAIVAWRGLASRGPITAVHVTADAIVATGDGGAVLWRYALPAGQQVSRSNTESMLPANVRTAGVYAIAGGRLRLSDSVNLGGTLFWLASDGRLRGEASLDDQPRFGNVQYGPPWLLADGRLDDRGKSGRIAVVAHHYTWWPSILTVFDASLKRQGSFVNAGWMEFVKWVAPDRIAVSGFSNGRNAAMAALLDPNALHGQSPEDAGGVFRCDSCGPVSPLRYVVLPRSEVNRVSGAAFNRARLDLTGDRVTIRTDEIVEADGSVADALYEFTAALDIVSASFSDRYWDMHRALELQGKIRHTRQECPDRDGPREIQAWEPATGWRTVNIHETGRH